jgi:hypothetical protein
MFYQSRDHRYWSRNEPNMRLAGIFGLVSRFSELFLTHCFVLIYLYISRKDC